MRLAMLALALVAAACGPVQLRTADPADPSAQVLTDAQRLELALATVDAINADGVDPIHLSPERLAQIRAACAIVEVAGALVAIRGHTLDLARVQAACTLVERIAE